MTIYRRPYRGPVLVAVGLTLSAISFFASQRYLDGLVQSEPSQAGDFLLLSIFLGSISGRVFIGAGIIDLILQRRRQKAFGKGSSSPLHQFFGLQSNRETDSETASSDSLERR